MLKGSDPAYVSAFSLHSPLLEPSVQVDSVDLAADPPSYGILLHGRFRLTERHRLAPRPESGAQATAPPPPLRSAGRVLKRSVQAVWPLVTEPEAEALAGMYCKLMAGLERAPGPEGQSSGSPPVLSSSDSSSLTHPSLDLAVLAHCPPASEAWALARRASRTALVREGDELAARLADSAACLASAACDAADSSGMFTRRDPAPALQFIAVLESEAPARRSARVARALAAVEADREQTAAAVAHTLGARAGPLLQAAALCEVVGFDVPGAAPALEQAVRLGTLLGAAWALMPGAEEAILSRTDAGPSREALALLRALTLAGLAEEGATERAQRAADAAAEAVGLGTVDCLLALALPRATGRAAPEPLARLAMQLLLRFPAMLCSLRGEEDEEEDEEEYGGVPAGQDGSLRLVEVRWVVVCFGVGAGPFIEPGAQAHRVDACRHVHGTGHQTPHLRRHPLPTTALNPPHKPHIHPQTPRTTPRSSACRSRWPPPCWAARPRPPSSPPGRCSPGTLTPVAPLTLAGSAWRATCTACPPRPARPSTRCSRACPWTSGAGGGPSGAARAQRRAPAPWRSRCWPRWRPELPRS